MPFDLLVCDLGLVVDSVLTGGKPESCGFHGLHPYFSVTNGLVWIWNLYLEIVVVCLLSCPLEYGFRSFYV